MARLTVSITDKLESELKQLAVNKKESVSKIAARAIEYYLKEIKRRELGRKVLDPAGTQKVSPDAVEKLEAGRIGCDRRI